MARWAARGPAPKGWTWRGSRCGGLRMLVGPTSCPGCPDVLRLLRPPCSRQEPARLAACSSTGLSCTSSIPLFVPPLCSAGQPRAHRQHRRPAHRHGAGNRRRAGGRAAEKREGAARRPVSPLLLLGPPAEQHRGLVYLPCMLALQELLPLNDKIRWLTTTHPTPSHHTHPSAFSPAGSPASLMSPLWATPTA